MPEQVKQNRCPHCGDTTIHAKPFCSNCGGVVLPVPERAAIDGYVLSKIDEELSRRLTDQNSLVRELGDKVEDVVRRRFKIYSIIIPISTLLLALWGVSTIDGAKDKIVQEARQRIEPTIRATEARVNTVQSQLNTSQRNLQAIGTEVIAQQKVLESVSSNVELQRRRVLEQTGEMANAVVELDMATANAKKIGAHFETEIATYGSQLNTSLKRFDAQISEVVRSNDRKQVLSVYSHLDDVPYVILNGSRIDKSTKKPNDRWVTLTLSSAAIEDHVLTEDKLLNLVDQLHKSGFTVYAGLPSLEGRWAGVLAPGALIRGTGQTRIDWGVYYFSSAFADAAKQILSITSHFIDTSKAGVQYVDTSEPQMYRERLHFLVNQSGLDCQLYISKSR